MLWIDQGKYLNFSEGGHCFHEESGNFLWRNRSWRHSTLSWLVLLVHLGASIPFPARLWRYRGWRAAADHRYRGHGYGQAESRQVKPGMTVVRSMDV